CGGSLALAVASRRQRESFALDGYEQPTQRTYSPVEIGGFGALEIGKEPAEPRREVLLEQHAIGAGRRVELSPDDPGHDLAQDRRMVLGLGVALGPLHAQTPP